MNREALLRPCVDARLSEQKIAVILSMSEGSRMVTLGVLFTGFFVAALLRMTEEDGGLLPRTLQASPTAV